MEDCIVNNVAVIGATGYAGAELMRLLSGHENVNIAHAVSKSFAGKRLSDVYKSFLGNDIVLEALDIDAICADSDIVFTCLPHGTSAAVVPALLQDVGQPARHPGHGEDRSK